MYECLWCMTKVDLVQCWRTNCHLYMCQFYASTYWGRKRPPICILCRYYLIIFSICVFKDKVLHLWKRIMQLAYASCSIIGKEWTEKGLKSTFLHARFEFMHCILLSFPILLSKKFKISGFLLLFLLVSLFSLMMVALV